MSEEKNNVGGAGFESEASPKDESQPTQSIKPPPPKKTSKSDEIKANLTAVFGHGPGKIAIIAVGVVVVIGLAFAYRGLTSHPQQEQNKAKMDVPTAPMPQVSVAPISQQEAARRAEMAQREAAMAAAQGKGYQPGFDPNISSASKTQSSGNSAQFNVDGNPPSPQGGAAQPVQVTVAAGQANSGAQSQVQTAESVQAEKELQAAKAERDKYINTIRTDVLKQVAGMFGIGESSQAGQPATANNLGVYSTVSYAAKPQVNPVARDVNSASISQATGKANTIDVNKQDDTVIGNKKKKMLIKTSTKMYAELDSEANTDDGKEVFATIRGGKWDGASIIGQIVQTPNNISLKFSVLSPSDDRPTMRIDAVALREQDAKLGMAENVNHHTFSRYTALGVASLFGGAGKAFAAPVGTSVVTNGQVVTTTNPPTNRQILGSAIGELGTAASNEIRRGFDQPTTYQTPATKGFILYFLKDIYEQPTE